MKTEDISIKKTLLYWAGFATLYTALALFSFQNRDPWSFSSTVWFPAGLLLAALWLTPRRDWPLWLITAGLLHALCGVYTGRPPLLATIFAAFDVVVFPLCVLLLRQLRCQLPVVRVLCQVMVVALCLSLGSILLSCCLLLAGYAVAPQHFLSWTLAALTAALSTLHLLHNKDVVFATSRWLSTSIIVCNLSLMLLLAVTDSGPWLGLNPLWLQFSALLLSVFILSARQVGLLLLLQYAIITSAVSFDHSAQATVLTVWQAQWYLIFSAILVGCLSQFVDAHRQLVARTQSEQQVLAQLAHTASCLMFTLELPAGEITWHGSPAAFFPDESLSVSTLELLNAHCSPPFLHPVLHWYSETGNAQFRQQLWVQRLTGERVNCMLLLQRIAGQPYLVGGLSLMA